MRGLARCVHSRGISRQLGAAVAALLIAVPLAAADDITFDPAITQADFQKFARVLGQSIYATPVQPARVTGFFSFDAGVAATIVAVDTNSDYWRRAVPQSSNFTRGGYLAVPRVVVAKGFGFATLSASYAKINSSKIKTYGASLDVPVIRGTLATPELALRGTYSALGGVDVLKLKTYGLELFVSKGFGPLMPYAAFGRMRSNARGTVQLSGFPDITLRDTSDVNRLTLGLRLSLFIPKFAIEATQAEQRSYAAKISVGF